MGEQYDVIVVGGGFSGIGMAIQLKRAGRDDFVVLEKDADLGGTWRDNTYPGCACDVPSYLYSFSFEQNPYWSRMFSSQQEIWDYLRHCSEKYDLGPHLRYDAEVTGARFDEGSATWEVEVNGGEVMHGHVLVMGVGALHKPKIPALPGIETFAGTTFHSARWDHDHDLTGKQVAVIGTGASAIQFVPQIAPHVERLDLYQRSAAWVTPRPNREISQREQDVYAKLPLAQRVVRGLVYWALEGRGVGFALTPKAMKLLEVQAQRHLANQVKDPVLRAKLAPDYRIGCKRILLSNDYYPALTRDSVEVITEPITEVRPHSVVDAAGVEREVDTIIFGTGFDVSGNLTSTRILGREGVELGDLWGRTGIGAHLGMTVAGFPNLFLLLGPNTGVAHSSVVFMVESQINYVLQALELLDQKGAAGLDVRPGAQQRFLDRIQNRLAETVWQSGCNSWYLDAHGRNFTLWPHFTWKYWLETRRLRPDDYTLERASTREEAPPLEGVGATAGSLTGREGGQVDARKPNRS